MKILVIGLDCAAPEILLGDERLVHLRRLMAAGAYGRLESVIPPITVPAWMCLATSQDPGSLGVYGFRNRTDHSYGGLSIANSRSIQELAIWDQLAREGKRSVIIGVPPSYPPRKVNGLCVGCFLTPDPARDEYTYPARIKQEIAALVGEYEVDVKGYRTDNKAWLRDGIFRMSRKLFQVVRHYLTTADWDYFQFVDIGLDRVHHGFWRYHDPLHVRHEPGSEFANVIRDYYLHLDQEIGRLLELVDDDTVVLVTSDHGARRLDGGFCVNEWLIREGLLSLTNYPEQITPFSRLPVDWGRTRVWSEGGYYARVFFNVQGREPDGTIDPAGYESFRDEMKLRLEGTVPGTLVYKPEEIYRNVRNVAPDLIVHFGALAYRSIGGVGYRDLVVQENDTGPDDCNHAQYGGFILAGPGWPAVGELTGVRLLDLAPTLLAHAGHDVPSTMQGRSLAGVRGGDPGAGGSGLSEEGERIIRERLSGLGYLG
ncbi:MAG TPA: alkaline phosphatase family protein [Gemmatimonadales bacterium]|nr:alkaline phosphatase family protein [Gemmatimonadales bacterium]